MTNPDVTQALRRAEGAVMCIDTAHTDIVRLRAYAAALLTEAGTALAYGYPDLALACVRRAERIVQGLGPARLCRPERDLPKAVRALRDVRLLVRTAYPDVPAASEVNLDSVLERLVAEVPREDRRHV
jgi:hypothetical protein